MCEIAIVGGGCSGVLVAAQILRRGFSGGIRIVEPREQPGRGLAYSTPFPQHLLNVPAGKMSAFADCPTHFLDWLRVRMPARPEPGFFAPRKLYGEYLEDVLETELRRRPAVDYRHIRAEVTGIERTASGLRLSLSEGPPLHAARVVLALGNPLSSPLPGVSAPELKGRWHASPWHDNALNVRFQGERILLIGAGLTAIDAVLALQSQDQGCQIHLVSRRGLLPQKHAESCVFTAHPDLHDTRSVRQLLDSVRAEIEEMKGRGGCWRTVVDALRPQSNAIWQGLSLAERARFFRHLKPYWEPHRHRMAPQVRRQIDAFLTEGNLRVLAGRIRKISAEDDSITANVQLRGAGEVRLQIDRIINCSGIQERYSGAPARPLIHALVASGLAEANDLGIGFRTDAGGALATESHGSSRDLFTLGPPRRGGLFETTAVPEIRAQAEALAEHLMREKIEFFSDGA